MADQTQTPWKNRIVSHGTADPQALQANPANFRRHTSQQRRALATVLDQIGFVQEVIINQPTGNMLDGHLRVSIAVERKEPSVPVTYVDLSLEEERLVLATFDPIGSMAEDDTAQLQLLVQMLKPSADEEMRGVLDSMVRTERTAGQLGQQVSFTAAAAAKRCPTCRQKLRKGVTLPDGVQAVQS